MKELLNDKTFDSLPIDSRNQLIYLGDKNKRFYNWSSNNIMKIRSKFKGLSEYEEINDIVGEIICASTLLQTDRTLDLIYEPLGTQKRAPDFKVHLLDGHDFYCEVRRIRRNYIEVRRDDFIDIFSSKIRLIPLNFGINLYCNDLKVQELSEIQIYEKLINQIDEIIGYIESELVVLDEEQNDTMISLNAFAEGLYVKLYSIPLNKRNNKVHYYGDLHNCPVTQNECYKFGDIIFDKLPQLVEGSPNLLFIITDNDSHWFEDLEDSISSIIDLLKGEDDMFFINKGYQDANDFAKQFEKLGGIFIQSRSLRGNIWINDNAVLRFDDAIIECLNECK